MIAQTPYQNMIYSQPQMAYTPQMYNPWTSRPQSQIQSMQMEQPQMQPQQVMQPQVKPLTGKVVQALEAITANDVPMDGSVAFFPKQDLSEIYIKSWNADGTIRTMTFKPVTENVDITSGTKTEENINGIMERFDSIENKLSEIEQVLGSTSTKTVRSKTNQS